MAEENWDKVFAQLKELTKDMPTPIITARQPPPLRPSYRPPPPVDGNEIIVIDYVSTLRPINEER